jgi:hypothetical protein
MCFVLGLALSNHVLDGESLGVLERLLVGGNTVTGY